MPCILYQGSIDERVFLGFTKDKIIEIAPVEFEKVKQARAKINEVYNLAQTSRQISFLIRDFDNLSIGVQNVFLKPIEEFPDKSYLFLQVKNSKRVLETVRSRCIELLGKDEASDIRELTAQELFENLKNGVAKIMTLIDKIDEEDVENIYYLLLQKMRRVTEVQITPKRVEMVSLLMDMENEIKKSGINKKLLFQARLSRVIAGK